MSVGGQDDVLGRAVCLDDGDGFAGGQALASRGGGVGDSLAHIPPVGIGGVRHRCCLAGRDADGQRHGALGQLVALRELRGEGGALRGDALLVVVGALPRDIERHGSAFEGERARRQGAPRVQDGALGGGVDGVAGEGGLGGRGTLVGGRGVGGGLVGGRALVGSALGGTVGRLGGQRDHDLLGQQGGCGLFGAHVRKRREACQRELSSGAVCGVGHVEGVVVGLLAGHVP